jgi:NADH-quinone oxidoreductase subunit M
VAPLESSILSILVILPAAATLTVLLIPREQVNVIRGVAAGFSVLTLLASFWLFFAYDHETGGFQFQQAWPWLASLGIDVRWGVDGISVPMCLLTGIVMVTGSLVSFNIKERAKEFFVLFMLLVTGVFGTFVSLDLFFLFFFYELAVLPMYLLIAVWGSTRKEYGALKLVLYLVAGSVLVWVALIAIWVAANTGGATPGFNLLELEKVQFTQQFQRVFFPLVLIGFGVLAGLWPFHTWSPDGHAAAPTAVSMLHAGVLMKLGAYGIIRVGMTLFPEGTQFWQIPFLVLATTNVVYGSIAALRQTDLKFMTGYSSVSHCGLVLIGLATLDKTGMAGGVLQMFAHGIMTALFFALIGVIYDRTHVREIPLFQGMSKRMGLTGVFFVIGGLSSLGLPGLAGFVAEVQVFIGAFRTFPIVAILGVGAAAITAVYVLRMVGRIFFGPLEPRWKDVPDAGRVEGFAMACLVVTLVVVGVYPGPFMDLINSGVTPLLARITSA